MTPAELARIRGHVVEQWRQRLAEEEQKDNLDPVALGIRIAKALDYYAWEIEQDIVEAISAAEIRRPQNGRQE